MKLKSLSWIIEQIPFLISGIALTVIIVITCANGLCRYLLGFTIPGTDEIVILGFGWTVFPGAAAGFRLKMHMGIDILVNLFPNKYRVKFEFLLNIFIMIVNTFLTYLGLYLAVNAWQKIMPATRIPYFYLDMAFVIGFGFMTYYSVKSVYESFLGLNLFRKGETA